MRSGGPADRSAGPPEKEGIQLSDAVTEELLCLEQERCRAVSAGDVDALGRLLTDDLTHTHVTGRTEGKAAYLAAFVASALPA